MTRPADEATGLPAENDVSGCDPTLELLAGVSEDAARVRRAAFSHLRGGRSVPLATLTESTGLSPEALDAALTELIAAGTVTLADDEVVAAAGLSVVPAAHRLHLDGVDLWTWCAFDAIGIPAALGLDAFATTRCPACAAVLEVALAQGRPPVDSPLFGWLPDQPCSNVQADFCPEANLFCSRDHLGQWHVEANDPTGRAYSLAELAARGAGVWAEMRGPAT